MIKITDYYRQCQKELTAMMGDDPEFEVQDFKQFLLVKISWHLDRLYRKMSEGA